MEESREKAIEEIWSAFRKMWKQTQDEFAKRGVIRDDPSGDDGVGGNRYNDLLDQHYKSLSDVRDSYLSLVDQNTK